MDTVSKKTRTLWIAIVQYSFLIYYLSFSNTLINNNYILIACVLVLLAEILLRQKFSLYLGIVLLSSVWALFCSTVNGGGYGSAITQITLLASVFLFSKTKLTRKQHKRVTLRMVFILLVILTVFSSKTAYGAYYVPILPYFPDDLKMLLSFGFCFCVYRRYRFENQEKKNTPIYCAWLINPVHQFDFCANVARFNCYFCIAVLFLQI